MQRTFLSSFSLRCARYLIKCYPLSWRERYCEEMLLILEDYQPTFRTLINLIFSLFDAYTHPHLLNERFVPMLQRMRSSELTIYSAAVVFFFAWFLALISVSTAFSRNLFSAFTLLFIIDRYTFPLLLLLIPLGGLPILLATAWKGLKARRYQVLLFLCLGLMYPLINFFLFEFLGDGIDIMWEMSLDFLCLGISLAFLCFAVQGVPPSRRVTHSVLYLATPLPLIMLVCCVSLLWYVLSACTTGDIAFFMMNEGYSFWFPVLCLMLLIMGAACSFSVFSLFKGFQAKRATPQTGVCPPLEQRLS